MAREGVEVAQDMDVQEKSGSRRMDSVQMSHDDRMFVSKSPVPNEMEGLLKEEQAPKVRKPYTITKQRERWTEEEHKKFLEALQLYGRAWRRIQEHIGSKSAVQIRSHAQKFFTKVARESDGSGSDTIKSIEIPPPRPKRKPLHPYPRKHNASSAPPQLDKPSLPKASFLEQESGSPTSVLPSFGSENMCSLPENYTNSCNSPLKSSVGSSGQESRGESPTTSDDEDNRPSPDPPCDAMTTTNKSAMDLDLSLFSKQRSLLGEQVPTLKLFGTTVLVSGSSKPTSSAGNTQQCSDSQSPISNQSHERSIDVNPHQPTQLAMQNGLDADFLTGAIKGEWNSWAGGASGLLLCLPFNKQNINMADAACIPGPWLAFYGNLPVPFIPSEELVPAHPRMDTSADTEMEKKEGSCSGSSIDSVNGGKIGEKNSNTELEKAEHTMDICSTCPSRLKTHENSSFSSVKTGSSEPGQGFMPYKRLSS